MSRKRKPSPSLAASSFRPRSRKAGAGKVTKTLAHAAFASRSYRGGRVSPSEGQAGGSGSI